MTFISVIENPTEHPQELVNLVNEMDEKASIFGEDYKFCKDYLKKFNSIGYTFEYGLDAIPHDLQPLK